MGRGGRGGERRGEDRTGQDRTGQGRAGGREKEKIGNDCSCDTDGKTFSPQSPPDHEAEEGGGSSLAESWPGGSMAAPDARLP
eukprot:172469-Hanusia_phi.AAC.1